MAGLEGAFDLMRMAEVSTTVSMALRPAAFIVSPDSFEGLVRGRINMGEKRSIPTRSTIPSATPNAHAASTLPLNSIIFVLSFLPA